MEYSYNELPLYQAIMKDDIDGIEFVALTSNPATQVNWVAFNESLKFSMDEEKRLVTSCLMLCDTPIFRRDNKLGEYYIKYDAETLRVMAEKLMEKNKTSNINIEHLDGSEIPGIRLQEIYIKDEARGISPIEFKDTPDGSLFATYKVHNDFIWESIKAGKYKGFSIEGFFTLEQPSDEYEELKEIQQMLKKIQRIKN